MSEPRKTQFLTDHKRAYGKLKDDMLLAIDEASPARKIHKKEENDRLHGGTVYANEIAGWEMLREFLETMDIPELVDADVPNTFTTPEQI